MVEDHFKYPTRLRTPSQALQSIHALGARQRHTAAAKLLASRYTPLHSGPLTSHSPSSPRHLSLSSPLTTTTVHPGGGRRSSAEQSVSTYDCSISITACGAAGQTQCCHFHAAQRALLPYPASAARNTTESNAFVAAVTALPAGCMAASVHTLPSFEARAPTQAALLPQRLNGNATSQQGLPPTCGS